MKQIPKSCVFHTVHVKGIIFLAFVTYYGKGDFIVWNQHGEECQRLYLFFHYYRLYRTYSKQQPHSLYHMADYSFRRDLMYLGRLYHYIFIVPEVKEKAFTGNLMAARLNENYHSEYETGHIFAWKNSTYIWMIGGSQIERVNNARQTKIINLE